MKSSIRKTDITAESCVTYTDEVMFREAAGSDVVLKELLREVLVHLCRFVGVHVVSKSFVQVCKYNIKSQSLNQTHLSAGFPI